MLGCFWCRGFFRLCFSYEIGSINGGTIAWLVLVQIDTRNCGHNGEIDCIALALFMEI